MSNRTKIILLFIFLFTFRTLFGLSLTFFGSNEIENDSLQTYLIGLKCYTTGTWPYFGPDQYRLDLGFRSQMPGALEGLVVGLPFYLLPLPEAPFIALNLLSLGALALLAWMIHRRLKEIPFLFILAWVSLIPWTLNRSTNVLNPSYLLFGSVLFFAGFLEAFPSFSSRKISAPLAFAGMGFGLFWDMQFHGSWVLLPVFPLAAYLWRRRRGEGSWWREGLGFLAGAAPPLAFLIPTLLKFGFSHGTSGIARVASGFNFDNFGWSGFFTILARYLSLPSFEIPRFVGSGTVEREAFLQAAPWLIPPAVFLAVLGWIQPFLLLVMGWFKDPRHPEAVKVQWLLIGAFFWIWFCFWFTSTGPASHMYYLFLPLGLFGSFYVWGRLSAGPGWRRFALAVLAVSFWFHLGFLLHPKVQGQSLFSHRERIQQALKAKDYHLLGERRPGSFY